MGNVVRVLTTFCTRCKPSRIASLMTLNLMGMSVYILILYYSKKKSRYRSGCEYRKQLSLSRVQQAVASIRLGRETSELATNRSHAKTNSHLVGTIPQPIDNLPAGY